MTDVLIQEYVIGHRFAAYMCLWLLAMGVVSLVGALYVYPTLVKDTESETWGIIWILLSALVIIIGGLFAAFNTYAALTPHLQVLS